MSSAGKPPRGFRLSQHLDLEAQLEVLQLKEKLQQMTEMVQQLLQHLDQVENVPGLFSKEFPKDSVGTQTSPSEESAWANGTSLKVKMKELVDMNINWQKYNRLQEKHIQELNDKIEEIQNKLMTSQEQSRTQFDEMLRLKEQENCQLKVEVEKLKLRLDGFASATNKKNSEIPREPCRTEREQILEAQLMLYKADFEAERRDREKAQAKVIQLELELLEPQRQTQRPSTGLYFNSDNSDSAASSKASGSRQNLPSKVQNISLSGLADVEEDGLPSSEFVSSLSTPGKEKLLMDKHRKLVGDGMMPGLKEDMLCCTKCFKVFTRSEHLELLEHFEQCHSN